MKPFLEPLLQQALKNLQNQGELVGVEIPPILLERTRDKQHGDFASSIAFQLAKSMRKNPRELAQKICQQLPQSEIVQRVEIAGNGFINFYLTPNAWLSVVSTILTQKEQYGRSQIGQGKKIHLEFVSANPTGPLHVGHGRGAAYGAVLADVLAAAGFDVYREYYVNDAGRQMDILATSVWLRYLQQQGAEFKFPDNGYRGDYVNDIAVQLQKIAGTSLQRDITQVFHQIPADESQGGDKEIHIDALIQRAKQMLGESDYRRVFDLALNTILDDIRDDLAEFGVVYQNWFSERSLVESGAVDKVIERLQSAGHLYQQDGAVWFRSTAFGDDKDRVVLRENGQPTYFAVDIAYRQSIFERGFTQLINILGADHHGYVPRIRASIQALEHPADSLTVMFVQFAILYRGKERVQMSTRSGSFVTLRELREDVGNDAARFFYVSRKAEQHMDFDLDLAKSQSNENPVYYVQYAHARICSVFRQLTEKHLQWQEKSALATLEKLTEPQELALLAELARYPEVVETAALRYEPHLIAHYLRDVASAFHSYYNVHAFIVDEVALRDARLALVAATRQVLANGLHLLGVSAPEVM